MKGSGGRCHRLCEGKQLGSEEDRRWKVCAKIMGKAENAKWFCRAEEWSSERQGGHGRERQMSRSCNGTDYANTPAKPLSTPLVNEMFSEAREESDSRQPLWSEKESLGVVCGPSLPSATPWILQESKALLSSLICGPVKTHEDFQHTQQPKKVVNHCTALFSAVLIRQWSVQLQLNKTQAPGLNSSVELEKFNQVLERGWAQWLKGGYQSVAVKRKSCYHWHFKVLD